MKKILILSALFLSVLSCSKENIPSNENEKQPLVFTAVIDNPVDTKTSIDAATGKVTWVLNDEITVTDASSNKAVYAVSSIDGDGKATFTYKSGSTSLTGSYSAKYGDVNNQWNNGNNGSGCPMTSDIIAAPSTEFRFTNDCGVFNISATATNIVKIEVSNETSSYALNLSAKVDMTAGTDYYMLAVPDGFSFNKITFVKDDNRKYTKTLSSSYSVAVGHLKKLKFTSADFNTDSNYDGYEYIALPGIFTINAGGEKVRFGKGNLQWNGTRYIFANEQYITILNSAATASNRDLFTWNESTTSPTGTTQPFNIKWRTLTRSEMEYITGNTTRGANRFICATVHERNGVILFPDSYTIPTGATFNTSNMNNANPKPGSTNFPVITDAVWEILENTGCVFLPGGGYKVGANYCKNNKDNEYNQFGNYWLNNQYSSTIGHSFWWNSTTENTGDYYRPIGDASHNKAYYFSVRLVIPAE